MKNLVIKVSSKDEIEIFTSVICLGLLEVIKNEPHSVYESLCVFSSPYSMQILREKGVSEELLTIINLLCELDDVESIIPDKLDISIDNAKSRLIKFMSSLPRPPLPREHWIENN